jgi:hypothetical protein
MGAIAAVASSVLAPAVGGVVSSIVGDIGKTLGAAGGQASPLNVLGGIGDAFGKLFGEQQQSGPSFFPPVPLPFSASSSLPLLNPFGALQNSLGLVKTALPKVGDALGALGGVVGRATGGDTSAPTLQSHFGDPDSLMAQAQGLLQPGPDGQVSMANVAKAQQLMQTAQLIFQTLSKIMEMQFSAAEKALNAVRAN